jgi:hypothetical protein
MFNNKRTKLAMLIFALLAFPQPAYAYIDPGTGSYVLQMILAVILAVPFVLKRYWLKIKSFFTSSRQE